MLKSGQPEDKIIRGISPQGGEELKKVLMNNPPMFLELKGKMVARSEIAQVVPVY